MANIYVDLINGDDTNGDGSASNPYKTLSKASEVAQPGDEVRVAKTPDPIQLSGTLTWTHGSDIVSTSQDLTGEVSVGDFIGKNDGWWYQVQSVSSAEIVLVDPYWGPDESTVGYKAQGKEYAPSSSYENCETWNSSGSENNEILISGGWNLSTEERDGFTVVISTTGTGRWFYASSKKYLILEYFIVMGFSTGIYPIWGYSLIVRHCAFSWNSYDIYNPKYILTISDVKSWGPTYFLYHGDDMGRLRLESVKVHNAGYGIYGTSWVGPVEIVNCEFRNNSESIAIGSCPGLGLAKVKNCTFEYGPGEDYDINFGGPLIVESCSGIRNIRISGPGCLVLINCDLDSPFYEHTYTYEQNVPEDELLMSVRYINTPEGSFKELWTAKKGSRIFTTYVERDSSEAKSDFCVKVSGETYETNLAWVPVLRQIPVPAGVKLRIKVWVKKSSDFSGSVKLTIRKTPLENWVVSEITPSTNWQQFSIDMPEPVGSRDAVIEAGVLYANPYNGSGEIYIDEISTEEIS